MADKSSQLILTALSRAAAAPAGAPLHGTKAVPGLFPTNAAGKQAAQRCQEDGYLCLVADEDALTAPTENGTGGTATLVKKKTAALAALHHHREGTRIFAQPGQPAPGA